MAFAVHGLVEVNDKVASRLALCFLMQFHYLLMLITLPVVCQSDAEV